MYYRDNTLGRDELKPSPRYGLKLTQTKIDKAIVTISQYLLDQYGGDWRWHLLPWLHPDLNRLLGVDGRKVRDFVTRYVDISREIEQEISAYNKDFFYEIFMRDYSYDEKTLNEYFSALMKLKSQGKIPKDVLRPYQYEPTTLKEDIAQAAGSMFEPVKKTLLPWTALVLIGAAAAYGLTAKGIPGSVESIVD